MSQSATQNAFRFDTGGLRQESERVAVTRKCILALPQCRGLLILFVRDCGFSLVGIQGKDIEDLTT